MSRVELMRPAARSAAVRPHSASSLRAPGQSAAPRPVSAASPCSASIFFVSPPRPVDEQSSLWAGGCSHGGWEHRAAWERFWEQECRAFSGACATVPTVPTIPRARVMRSRARACIFLSLCLDTWEHSELAVVYQWLKLFPRLFPALQRVGTWEQSEAAGCLPDRSTAQSNKLEAGYASPHLAGGDARRKFRSPARAIGALVELDLQRIRQLPTRRGANGGKLPFLGALGGRVGRLVLEGSAQGAEIAAQSAARPKLGRLRGLDLAELAAGDRATLLEDGDRSPSAIEGPGGPHRARRSPAMRALHARRIWIESAFHGPFPGGDYSNRASGGRKMAQTVARQRGPGGNRTFEGAKSAKTGAIREVGERAGVNFPRQVARPHDAGEKSKLRRVFAAVNGGF